MLGDAIGSVSNEPDCLRFDVIQDEEDPNKLYLHEVYKDKSAFENHMRMPHFIKWRDTIQDWLTAPIESGRGSNLFPKDADWNKHWKTN